MKITRALLETLDPAETADLIDAVRDHLLRVYNRRGWTSREPFYEKAVKITANARKGNRLSLVICEDAIRNEIPDESV